MIRAFYVGATRTRETLYICQRESALTKDVKLKMRVQHPKVHLREVRKGTYWFFRYWHDELLANGSVAGHGSVNMTNDYTHMQLKRQEELTRAIQDRLGEAARKVKRKEAVAVQEAVTPTCGGPVLEAPIENVPSGVVLV